MIRIRLLGTRHPVFLRLTYKPKFGKKLRKLMKNPPSTGRSARRGNRPAPYTKYHKVPYSYTFSRFKAKDATSYDNRSNIDRSRSKRSNVG